MSEPKIAALKPAVLNLEPGTYYWCACGASGTQPFCDGSHKGTGLSPTKVVLAEARKVAWCGCKQTKTPCFCDGTHAKVHFDGTETASREPYLKQAETIEGPTMVLTDAESLCAFARFCDPKGRIWNLVAQTDNPEARRLV